MAAHNATNHGYTTQVMTTDWWQVITDLQRAGIPMTAVERVMDSQLTDKMLVHYRAGTEPQHWRGELLLTYWCQIMHRAREDRPMRAQVKGRYRAIGKGVRPSHEALQPGYSGPLLAQAMARLPVEPRGTAPIEVAAPAQTAPTPERRKPGPKPGSKRRAAETV